jgi:hypothetical protein
MIGEQHDAIGHRYLEVFFDDDIIGFSGGEFGKPRENAASNTHQIFSFVHVEKRGIYAEGALSTLFVARIGQR